jgi:hypothetical protein
VPGHGGFWAAARAVGDGIFTCPARRTARTFASAYQADHAAAAATATATANENNNNNNGSIPGGPFLYFFNHTLALLTLFEPLDPTAVDPIGVFHGSELPFVFDFQLAERGAHV